MAVRPSPRAGGLRQAAAAPRRSAFAEPTGRLRRRGARTIVKLTGKRPLPRRANFRQCPVSA